MKKTICIRKEENPYTSGYFSSGAGSSQLRSLKREKKRHVDLEKRDCRGRQGGENRKTEPGGEHQEGPVTARKSEK